MPLGLDAERGEKERTKKQMACELLEPFSVGVRENILERK